MPILLLSISSLGISKAKDTGFIAVGLRVGTSSYVTEVDFITYELFGFYGLPWSWQLYSDWVLRTRWNLAGGVIKQDGDIEFLTTFGPGIAIGKTRWPISIDGGVGLALLSDEEIGKRNFGAPLQFTAYGGISYKFGRHFALGYRFHHMSDMGFFDGKGVNRNLLELIYYF